MRLLPVPAAKLDCLLPIFEEAQKEFGHASPAERSLSVVKQFYGPNGFSAYADSLQDPKHCVILQVSLGLFSLETVAVVNRIFTKKAHRGGDEFLPAANDLIHKFAEIHGCGSIAGASWVLDGHKDLDSFWKSNGFRLQEKMFIKHI